MGRKKMQDRFKTLEDANERYETMISELKNLHSDYIFLMKIKGYDLDRIQFEYDDEYMAVFVFKKTIPDEDTPSIKSVCLTHTYQLFHVIDMSNYEARVHTASNKLQEMILLDKAKNDNRSDWDELYNPDFEYDPKQVEKKVTAIWDQREKERQKITATSNR